MKLKRILAFALSAALLLSMAPAISLSLKASAETEITYNTYNAGDSTVKYAKANIYQDNGNSWGGGSYNLIPQTWAALTAGESVNDEVTRYVAWIVDAPSAGTYYFAPGYGFGLNGASCYNMVLSVNDRDYYKGKDTTTGVNIGGDVIAVQLTKGRNVIRLLPLSGPNYRIDGGSWVDVWGLGIDSRLTVVEHSSATPNIQSMYYNRYKTEGAYLGGVSHSARHDINDWKKSNLKDMSYVSFTVDAPADGYYSANFRYLTSSSWNGQDAYFIARVNGQNSRVAFKMNAGQYATFSVYLTKGTNVITLSNAYKAADDAFYSWFNPYSFTIHGATMSATQIDPATVEDALRLEAETKGIRWRYNNVNAASVGGVDRSNLISSNVQSYDTIASGVGMDKANLPMISYVVDVPAGKAGQYLLSYKYTLSSTGDHKQYFMTVAVNDEEFHKANYAAVNHVATGEARVALSQIPVTLKEGRNVIRMISVVRDTLNLVSWLDPDYLEIGSGSSRINAVDPGVLHLQSGKSAYTNNFQSKSSSEGNTPYFDVNGNDYIGSFLGSYRGNVAESAGVNAETLVSSQLHNMRSLGYFAYTVEVPADGYYDMATYFTTGNASSPACNGYIALIDLTADGEFTVHKKVVYDDPSQIVGGNAGWQYRALKANAQNLSVYLTKGTHTLVVSGILEQRRGLVAGEGDLLNRNGYTDWCDMGALTVSGGITLAATQIDPLSYLTRTNPAQGLIPGSAYTADGTDISGVPVGTTVLEFISNFYGSDTITVEGAVNGTVVEGTKAVYADGTVYTVTARSLGDLNNDGKIDIRDLKIAKEYSFGETDGVNVSEGDIISNSAIDASDVQEYRNIIFGKPSDVFYQPSSIGADALLELANPVGRPVKYLDALLMEASASNFTLTGDISGDVYLNYYLDKIQGDQVGLFVEIDGEMSYVKLDKSYETAEVKIASGLTAGEHVIKVSKSTDGKNDDIFIHSVRYNGKLTKSEAAAHKIVFLGDSITAGCGVYASGTEGMEKYGITASYFSYANIAADALNADYYSVANGGWVLNYTGNPMYAIQRIYPMVSQHAWNDLGTIDFANAAWKPDVVVINLGTNDRGSASEEVTRTNVRGLLADIRAKHPNAAIFYAYGMMEEDHANVTWIREEVEAFGAADGNAYYVQMPENTAGWGAHPTVEGQAAAGNVLAEAIAAKLGWEINK